MDKDIDAFSSSAWPKCPPNCGDCCKGFEPDLGEPEALYLAAYIFLVRPELAERLAGRAGTEEGKSTPGRRGVCPLYDPSRDEHCPIYPARPLICRGFAVTAVAGKDGPVFRLCSMMPDRGGRRIWKGEEIEREFGVGAPLLDRYGRRLDTLSMTGKRELLGTAGEKALLKIRYYHDAVSRSDGDDDLPRSA